MKKYTIDGAQVDAKGTSTITWIDDNYFTIDFLGKSYHGEVLSANIEERTLTVSVNHRIFDIKKNHPLDDLIKSMGLDKKKVRKLHQLSAPMPGRIISYAVAIGDTVSEGTPLLTLEAMKMENVIKAEGEGIVKSLAQNSNSIVDKGQLLIEFE